jgi:hypothetical protein
VVGSVVDQVTLALERVMLLVARSAIWAGTSVVVMLGVRLTVGRPVGLASTVGTGESVPLRPNTVDVGVRVGERVGVAEKIGPTVPNAAWTGVEAGRGVGVAVRWMFGVGDGLRATVEVAVAVEVGVGVRVAVAVSVGVAVAEAVAVPVPVDVGVCVLPSCWA